MYNLAMLYLVDTGVNSEHSHILMVSEPAPRDNGAEVPIAGAHVLLEGQGVGADRQKPLEDARMTMSRFSFARLWTNKKIRRHSSCQRTGLLCSSCDLQFSQVLRRSGHNVCSHVVSFALHGNYRLKGEEITLNSGIS